QLDDALLREDLRTTLDGEQLVDDALGVDARDEAGAGNAAHVGSLPLSWPSLAGAKRTSAAAARGARRLRERGVKRAALSSRGAADDAVRNGGAGGHAVARGRQALRAQVHEVVRPGRDEPSVDP